MQVTLCQRQQRDEQRPERQPADPGAVPLRGRHDEKDERTERQPVQQHGVERIEHDGRGAMAWTVHDRLQRKGATTLPKTRLTG